MRLLVMGGGRVSLLSVPGRSLSASPRDDLDADIVEQVLRPGEGRRLWPRWTFTVLRRATSADLRPSPYPAHSN